LAIKWKDIHDVFFLTTSHEDVLVEAPSSRGTHHKMKPSAVLDYKYKTGVDRSDQMLSYYKFKKKTIKWWKKLFFRLFDLVVVNAHILRNKTSKKKMLLEIFYERVAEGLLASASTEMQGLLASAGTEMQVQGQTSSPAGRLVRRDHFLYRIPATHAKVEGTSQRSCHVCVQKEANARPGKL
jgi:hypothetical protein